MKRLRYYLLQKIHEVLNEICVKEPCVNARNGQNNDGNKQRRIQPYLG